MMNFRKYCLGAAAFLGCSVLLVLAFANHERLVEAFGGFGTAILFVPVVLYLYIGYVLQFER
jgi:uncharacterized membrane protein